MQAEGGELRAEVREPGRTTGREDENDYHHKFRKQLLRAMPAPEKYVHDCGLEPKLLELVKMRASQINGCAYCTDMHSKDPRALGETAAALCAERVARDALLQRAETRSVATDGSGDVGVADACTG